ncbi:uncharacterized protein [Misgurnus anguillicaudatus]|uniref:uncharacterized protein n=1 Tax=Misgurnus anguillicaudatus TaxID=75329 RepID=UPI003CCF4317
MEKVRGSLITLMCVLLCEHQTIFATEVKIRVKPGDNVTLFCDCVIPLGSQIYWIRNNSYENQSSLSINAPDLFTGNFQRFSFVPNSCSNSYDLHIENISVLDEGIYYCAKVKIKLGDNKKSHLDYLEYQYGKWRTHLSVLDPDPPAHEVSEIHFNCWMLISLCSVCILLSSILSGACVYCLCHPQTTGSELNAEILKANVFKMDHTKKHQCVICKTGKFCVHTEVSYSLLTSADHHYA